MKAYYHQDAHNASIRSKIKSYFMVGKPFRREFRRQLKLLVILSVGFTIAFAWRQTFFNSFQALIILIFPTESSVMSDVLTALFLTLIGIFIIFITSAIFKDKSYL